MAENKASVNGMEWNGDTSSYIEYGLGSIFPHDLPDSDCGPLWKLSLIRCHTNK